MHVISRKKLIEFYSQPDRRDAKGPIEAWYDEAKRVKGSPAEKRE